MTIKGVISHKYIVQDNGKIVDTTTGEIVSKKDVKKLLQNEVADYMLENELEMQKLGETLGLQIVTDKRGAKYSVLKVKGDYEFVKVFKVALREALSDSGLSKVAKATFLDFQSQTSFPTNTIIRNGTTPNTEQLCEWLDLKKSSLYNVLKELEECEFIRRVKVNGQTVIYINPFVYCCGLVDQFTVTLFESSKYNPNLSELVSKC